MPISEDGGLIIPHNRTLRCIAVEARRDVLNALFTKGPPITLRELAAHLVAVDRETRPPDLGEIEGIRVDLAHVHLPALEAAGLVAFDRVRGSVETTRHPALADPRFRRLLKTDLEGLDDVLYGLAHEYRRIVLTILKETQAPVSVSALRENIVRQFGENVGHGAEEISLSLIHAHLPKLAEVDLIEYDPETGRATYTSHSTLEGVFAIIHGSDVHVVDQYGGFLAGLSDSVSDVRPERSYNATWPHFWGGPHRG